MIIECVSQRLPCTVDVIYGTGQWEPGETKDVPDDIGKKMIRHIDVYAERREASTSTKVLIAPPSPDEPLQEVYDSLRNMTYNQIKDFVQIKFNMPLSKRQYPNVEAARSYATMLVEQFGVN